MAAKKAAEKTKLPKPRRLKLGSHSSDIRNEYNEWSGTHNVPYLRISGDWLSNAGFKVGKYVRVHVAEQCITLIPEP
jgi:Toxin SymE, type I toxin-antitoxin system